MSGIAQQAPSDAASEQAALAAARELEQHCRTIAKEGLEAKVVPSDHPLLMLTTNYDDALEQALREVDVPYDAVTYVTDYPERTRGYFTHSSWQPGDEEESRPIAISRAKSYTNLLKTRPAI